MTIVTANRFDLPDDATDYHVDPIAAVWEQYKHLDRLLSDPRWWESDGQPLSATRRICCELWVAIRTEMQRREASK